MHERFLLPTRHERSLAVVELETQPWLKFESYMNSQDRVGDAILPVRIPAAKRFESNESASLEPGFSEPPAFPFEFSHS